jgi:L-asparaginase/beta-aspartyl-peptidase (threonine type)
MEMDGALMTSEGRIGAVAAVRGVRNPIRVARQVMQTPHLLLMGTGASEFARRHGLAQPVEPTPEAIERHRQWIQRWGTGSNPEMRADWRDFPLARNWNFETPYEEVFGCDTIGAVALDQQGQLAVANSTGGAFPMLAGRVGDSPLPGCGFYCGPAAAVAATGWGERIIERMASREVYDAVRFGESPQRAAAQVVDAFPKEVPVGIIAISRRGVGVASNRDMACWTATTPPNPNFEKRSA